MVFDNVMLRGAKQRLEYCPTRSSVSNSPHQYRESRAVKFVDLANPRTSLFLFSSRGTRRTVRGGGFFSFFLAFPSFLFPFLWTSQTLSWRNVDETSFPSLLFLFSLFLFLPFSLPIWVGYQLPKLNRTRIFMYLLLSPTI